MSDKQLAAYLRSLSRNLHGEVNQLRDEVAKLAMNKKPLVKCVHTLDRLWQDYVSQAEILERGEK